jgi:uncharacterized membrane protein YfcA
MIQRWAQRHERAFLTVFVTLVLTVLAGAAIGAAADGYALEAGAAWLVGFLVTAVAMLLRHRSGRLILRRARDRERQRAANQAGRSLTPAILGAVMALAVVRGLARHVAFAVIGGIFTAIGPVLLWIAFVLRPDERPGEDL